MLVVLSPQNVFYALLAVSIAALAVPLACEYQRKERIKKGLAPIPGPKGRPIVGVLPDLIANSHRINDYLGDLMQQHGGRMQLPGSLFSEAMVYLASPEDVQHVLTDKLDNYVRADRFIEAVGPVFQKSFLGLNHAHTAKANSALLTLQRKVVTKVMNVANFRVLTEQIFHKYALETVDIIKNQSGKCNMHDVSTQYALQAIFDISIGIPLHDVNKDHGVAFVEAMDYVFAYLADRLVTKPYYKYFWWCMPSEYKMKRSEQVMMELADGILSSRLVESDKELDARSDVMSLFIKKARELSPEEKDGDGAELLDVETLRSIFLTFLFAGKDPSSSLITYTLYALTLYPDVQQKVLDELLQQKREASDVISYNDLKNLPYLDAVVNETMRLYPTLPYNFKVAAQDDCLPDGTFIPAGTELAYANWYMGRNNPIFGSDDLSKFRPERWLEMKTRPSAYDFPAFQGGQRICIGMNMALIEVKVFVAVMVCHFDISIQAGEKTQDRGYILSPTLIMDGGLPLQMTPRA